MRGFESRRRLSRSPFAHQKCLWSQDGRAWDNIADRVNGQFVFRFSRWQVAVDLLTVEQNVLPAIAPCLALPVPVPTMAGQPDDHSPWSISGYRLLPGRGVQMNTCAATTASRLMAGRANVLEDCCLVSGSA